jgi:protein gp37
MKKTKIEWTENTWNPVTGCDKISPGCKNCYAERMAKRLSSMNQSKYSNGFKLTLQPDALYGPYKWKQPRLVFVNSMSDLFHENIPVDYIKKVFKVMNECKEHQFQILTKRSGRLIELSDHLNWTKNIWMGVSIESQKYLYRIDDLRGTPSYIKFISFEPLLEEIKKINLFNIDWVIVGGESGPKARLVEESWVKSIQKECQTQNVSFFFKQWGGINKKKTGRVLDGKKWNEMPVSKLNNNKIYNLAI